MNALHLYGLFHLNLAYSSVDETQHREIIEHCYWPLLELAHDCEIPLAVEASGWTLERIAALDPAWLRTFIERVTAGELEFVGSGYCQIIGPLVPAELNAHNQRLGQDISLSLLGQKARFALINEQAFSMGLIEHYVEAGYEAIVMEWENAFACHPEWENEWRYLPQRALGNNSQSLPLFWNSSISFQKLQRALHGEMSAEEYCAFIRAQQGETPRYFSFYGNDAEVLDFRPGCYHTETALGSESEWTLLRELLQRLGEEEQIRFVSLSRVLEEGLLLDHAGQLLQLCSAEQPIPVKKQDKYNVLRWAVSGRHDLLLNTKCWRLFQAIPGRPTGHPGIRLPGRGR